MYHMHDFFLLTSFRDTVTDPFTYVVGDAALGPIFARVDRVSLVLEATYERDCVSAFLLSSSE